ncbi:MAG: hypothetical protein QME96_14975 [Myxococcota bacterium]|nr:hypothetical protein [Myxococcota bacterium]
MELLPAASIAVARVDLKPHDPAAVAVASAAAARLQCLAPLLPSLDTLVVALVPDDREFAALLLVEGAVSEPDLRACAADLARTLAARAPPEGSSPPVLPAGTTGAGMRPRFIVGLDAGTERLPRGLRNPVAGMLTRLAGHPVAFAVEGGEALRSLSSLAVTYLPFPSMGTAADRILAVGCGLRPLPDGGAELRMEIDLVDAAAAAALARQIRNVGRIVSLPGDEAAWAPFRERVHSLAARVAGDGSTVEADAILTPEGLRGLLL